MRRHLIVARRASTFSSDNVILTCTDERILSEATPLDSAVSIPHLEALALERLPHMAAEWLLSGAADEVTLRWNREAFDRIALRPRVMADDTPVDTRVSLFGEMLPFPILLAPFVVSTGTTTAIEDIARVATSPLWFQLYVQSDRDFTRDVVRTAEDAGCRALVVTVDTPVIGARVPSAPRRLHGVIVSNHGGRNLDTLPASVDALPEVVSRVAGRVPVLMDGGIRRWTDVLKAMALGAGRRPRRVALPLWPRHRRCRRRQSRSADSPEGARNGPGLVGRPSLRDVDRSVLWRHRR